MEEKTFLDHLEELRRRLLISLAALGGGAVSAYFFSASLLEFLIQPLRRFQEVQLYFHSPTEAFVIHLVVSFLVGLFVSSPVLFSELWLFIAPGLYRKERRWVIPLILVSTLLFAAGAAFSFKVVVPFGLHFFLSFQSESLKPLIGVGPYFSFLFGMVIGTGIVFVLPVVLLGLVKLGVLSSATLRRSRRVFILGIFVLAAILTPSPDPGSQLLLALPLVVLLEISIFCARWVERK